jgi:hypothetical protein
MASRLRLIALNNSAGFFTDVLATGPTRQVELFEDEAGGATQGLQVKSLLDNFATVNTFTFGSEPLTIPNILRYPAGGRLLGMNAQGVAGNFNFRAADKLVSARSNGAAGTSLRVTEYD